MADRSTVRAPDRRRARLCVFSHLSQERSDRREPMWNPRSLVGERPRRQDFDRNVAVELFIVSTINNAERIRFAIRGAAGQFQKENGHPENQNARLAVTWFTPLELLRLFFLLLTLFLFRRQRLWRRLMLRLRLRLRTRLGRRRALWRD